MNAFRAEAASLQQANDSLTAAMESQFEEARLELERTKAELGRARQELEKERHKELRGKIRKRAAPKQDEDSGAETEDDEHAKKLKRLSQ